MGADAPAEATALLWEVPATGSSAERVLRAVATPGVRAVLVEERAERRVATAAREDWAAWAAAEAAAGAVWAEAARAAPMAAAVAAAMPGVEATAAEARAPR